MLTKAIQELIYTYGLTVNRDKVVDITDVLEDHRNRGLSSNTCMSSLSLLKYRDGLWGPPSLLLNRYDSFPEGRVTFTVI
jgi:hypothetical protein